MKKRVLCSLLAGAMGIMLAAPVTAQAATELRLSTTVPEGTDTYNECVAAKEYIEEKKKEEIKEPETKVCPYCLTEIKYHATRCPNCTSELVKEKEEV